MGFVVERLMSHIDMTPNPRGCWIWTGSRTSNGYGKYSGTVAHRAAYQALVAPLTSELQLDHLCGVPLCVNPAHLDPVNQFENMRRRFAAHRTCRNGHAWTDDNTYRRPTGHRDCRACIRERSRTYKERTKDRRVA